MTRREAARLRALLLKWPHGSTTVAELRRILQYAPWTGKTWNKWPWKR